jgi:cytochrome c553
MIARSVACYLCVASFALTGLRADADAEEFNLQETVELCASCHGEAGVPGNPKIPIIWGQTWYYIYVQLRDYKAGRRANEIMSDIVKPLQKKDMQALATYFSEKKWPAAAITVNAAAAEKGVRQTVAGQCSQCHSTYQGDSRVPRLAGQLPDYLTKTMLDFKNKVRLNSPAKGSLMASYADDDIKNISEHLADLSVR